MSRETSEWLNTNVLIGFTDRRGKAWHWRAGSDNHYPQAIPVEEVKRRLFAWSPVKTPVLYHDGERMRRVYNQQVIYRDDTGGKLGIVGDGYRPHPYSEWLIQNVANMLDDDVHIGSAGLLRGGAIAWVQVELQETRVHQGVDYRPTILATTSLDGSISSVYKPVNTIVVCDNTRSAAMREDSAEYRVRHTKNSKFEIAPAREKVGIILEQQADAFDAELDRLISTEVSQAQFDRFLQLANPIPEDEGRARTIAVNRRDKLESMYARDPRVAPWRGTAWGVMQLMNTYSTHEATRKGNKAESQFMSLITGSAFQADDKTSAMLSKALAKV